MAITGSNPILSDAIVYRNATSGTLIYHRTALAGPNVNNANLRYDRTNPPFSLGSGVTVNSTGRYLMNPANNEPISEFLVINAGSGTIYAGINAVSSGSWSIADGLTLQAGESYQFGEHGTEIIRNVWSKAASERQLVQGYATNILQWI